MNIVLEGNIDFYALLNNTDTDDEAENENICLLTHIPLDKNSIKLQCNHSFNFMPLYKEVLKQKIKSSTTHYNTDKLLFHQIKCPYCRQKHNELLPHIRLNKNISFISGVNGPEYLCMKSKTCTYVFKSGKNKNNCCPKSAYYDVNGCYCTTHRKNVSKKASTTSNGENITNKENNELCKAILKTGKRVGQECCSKTSITNIQYCKRHLPKV